MSSELQKYDTNAPAEREGGGRESYDQLERLIWEHHVLYT